MKELLKRKGLRIALLAVALLVAAGVVGINAQSAQRDKEYNRHMDAAEKYLSDLDYEQAIAEYTLALEIEPKEEVLDALTQAYLAYAQATADAGDFEGAIAILEEGYEVTGAESLQEKIRELESGINASADDGEADMASEGETPEGMIDFPFEVTDITIKGYNLLSDHYNEVIGAYGCPPPSEENGYISLDGSLEFNLEGISCRVGAGMKEMMLSPSAGVPSNLTYQVFSHEYNGQCSLTVWGKDSDGSWADYDVNIPIDLQSSYEEWCRIMQVDRIKEIGEKVEIEPGSAGEGGEKWAFLTKQGDGEYLEFPTSAGDVRQVLTLNAADPYLQFQIIRMESGEGTSQINITVLFK